MKVTASDGFAWVTGASSGIGEAVVRRLAADGWTVVASARRADRLAALAGQGGTIVPLPVDVTDRQAVHAALDGVRQGQGQGHPALAILNAGTYAPDSAETLDAERFRRTFEVNVTGVVNCLEAILPGMIERRRGHVAIVASVAGYRGLPRAIAYGASKAALNAMAESLKFDLDRHGVGIQVINPGFVRTPLTDANDFPMPFLMEVEAAADALVDGLARNAFEISFPRRFTFWLKRLRCLPHAAYFPLVARATGRR